MTEWLLTAGANNLALSAALALVAWLVHARARRPWLAHLLWLLVLVKLVTPPLVSAPLLPSAGDEAGASAASAPTTFEIAASSIDAASIALTAPTGEAWSPSLLDVLFALWIAGSLVVLAVSLTRIARFERLLRRASVPADDRVRRMARQLAGRLELRRVPDVRTVEADLAPLVWWLGGRVRVVLPAAMASRLDQRALRLVLAHELAHVRRRDHCVRWLEWLAVVAFWWNPVLWIARRGLRATEEICCDALVVERLSAHPNTYASSLLDAIELLATPALRPPATASQMTSGGALEQRLTMLLSQQSLLSPSRWTRLAALALATVVLPLGVARAQAPDYDAVSARLLDAVAQGELSEAQAQAMFGALAEQHFAEALHARRSHEEHAHDLHDELRHRELREREAHYHELQVRMHEALERGEISHAEAERELLEVRMQLFGELHDEEMERRKLHLHEVATELQAMVEAGVLSELEMKERLMKLEHELFGDHHHDADVEDRKRQYEAMANELYLAWEAGLITELEMKTRLDEMHRELFDAETEQRERRIEEAIVKLEAMLAAGEISADEFEHKLAELEQKLAAQHESHAHEPVEHELHDAYLEHEKYEQEVRAALERGDISYEEAEKMLQELREKLDAHQRELDDGKRKLDEARIKLKGLVESGEMTEEEMKRRLEAYAAELFGKREPN